MKNPQDYQVRASHKGDVLEFMVTAEKIGFALEVARQYAREVFEGSGDHFEAHALKVKIRPVKMATT